MMEQDRERAKRFGEAMSFFTTDPGFSLHHLTDGYPWDSISKGTVVDLGGSHGDAAFALARKYNNLSLVVQDLSKTIAGCKEQEGLDVKFMAHDFFEDQVVKNADVYLYRSVLHNWPDKYCIKILKALVPALKKGARILVNDGVTPAPGVLANEQERELRTLDLTMLEIGNAKERELDEWKLLFEQADARFVFQGMRMPPGSKLAIIEATWDT